MGAPNRIMISGPQMKPVMVTFDDAARLGFEVDRSEAGAATDRRAGRNPRGADLRALVRGALPDHKYPQGAFDAEAGTGQSGAEMSAPVLLLPAPDLRVHARATADLAADADPGLHQRA
jgi:hypothetical protein